jgi:hypothetical protein
MAMLSGSACLEELLMRTLPGDLSGLALLVTSCVRETFSRLVDTPSLLGLGEFDCELARRAAVAVVACACALAICCWCSCV